MKKTHKFTLSAMLAAIIFIATFAVHIPLPGNGYVHMGDCFVLISGWILGPVYGAIAAGIGSMLADICAGFPVYVGATLIIKAMTAALAAITCKCAKNKYVSRAVSGILGACIVPVGYFAFEYFMFGAAVAVVDIWGNVLQCAVGVICAVVLGVAIDKIHTKTGLN